MCHFSLRGAGSELNRFHLIKKVQYMAITINLRYTGANGSAIAFANEMMKSGTVAKIHAEDGNLRYEYYQSLDFLETVHVPSPHCR